MTYEEMTISDRNPAKRWLQRRRFADAIKVLKTAQHGNRIRVCDFGGGDGELIRQLAMHAKIEAWLYEPTPWLLTEAKDKLEHLQPVVFLEDVKSLPADSFDYVFCLEVFEHLPQKETAAAIQDIHRILNPGGFAVIGVPHELFLPALLKGLFRMSRRYGEFDANPRNIIAALLGSPPTSRPVAEIATGVPYHFHHMGFDFRVLEKKLRERFLLAKKWFSPLPIFGRALNSEVYFILEKADPRD